MSRFRGQRSVRVVAALALAGSMGVVAPRAQQAQPESPLVASFAQHQRARRESPYGLQWLSLGPALNSARVEAVQGDPAAPGTIYAAFGSGNLWKSTNGGLSFRPIFEGQSALGIGDIALAPSDSRVIWLGSGESLKKPRNFTMPGTGVFLSRDAGETWHNVGLADSWHIGEIAVHPRDPEFAIVAVLGHFWSTNEHRGIYRTEDGGETWEHVLFVDDRTGGNDVVIAPSDPNVVYASTWCNYPSVAGVTSGVHRSDDGGRTWTRLGGGLPTGDGVGRIGLAVSWADPQKVYAFVDNLGRDSNFGEVYRSDDGGDHWRRTHADDLEINSRIGWYFSDCYVNPSDDDEVYALGVRIARSRDGGATFELVGGDVHHLVPSPAQRLHLDHCELWIDPHHPDRLLLGNDGGLYSTLDRGATWLHHNDIPAGEFYDVAVDRAAPYTIYGGTQDDSSVCGPATERRPGRPDAWRYVWLDPWCGGDGCYTVPDPEDPATIYFSSQHGGLRRQDTRTNRSVAIPPKLPKNHGGELRHNFIAPYVVSAHDHRVLYHGGNYVMQSSDRGDSWRPISPDLSQSQDEDRCSPTSAAGGIAESPVTPGLLYCGTDRGAFWVRTGDDAEWVERSAGLPPFYVRSIRASRFAASRVYVALSGINYDDLHAHVYASDDQGATWRSIQNDLPDQIVYAITEDPVHEDVLYVATYRGVYVSTDRGSSWSLFGRSMPDVAVADLVVQEGELDLIAGTHGRGIYRLDLKPLHHVLANGGLDQDLLLPIPVGVRPRRSDTLPLPIESEQERLPITFCLREASDVTITVVNEKGAAVFTGALAGRSGLNQFCWDLVTVRRASSAPYFTNDVEFCRAGSYTLKITGDGIELIGQLQVTDG